MLLTIRAQALEFESEAGAGGIWTDWNGFERDRSTRVQLGALLFVISYINVLS